MHFSFSTPLLFHLWSFVITFTLCSLVIHFDGIAALSVVVGVCVCILSSGLQLQSSVALYSEVFAVDPCAATDEYMCSAGEAHLPPLTGEGGDRAQ